MNPAVKKKWVEALRSGEYSQATQHLRGPDGYCCLGVLCDIASVGEWRGGSYLAGTQSCCAYPPGAVVEEAGLELALLGRLAEMNDKDGKSFNEIADYIEANL